PRPRRPAEVRGDLRPACRPLAGAPGHAVAAGAGRTVPAARSHQRAPGAHRAGTAAPSAAPATDTHLSTPRVAAPKTRDRILDTSLALFNQHGLASVSTHRIAAELGISPGNLHYHFRAKSLIVTWLFRRFEERFAPCVAASASVTAL